MMTLPGVKLAMWMFRAVSWFGRWIEDGRQIWIEDTLVDCYQRPILLALCLCKASRKRTPTMVKV